ncbi:MAG: hypothetical protein Q7K42_01085, partial [Candidatus Diapherotrites archaeon]|nr:hypothetical protein [Candidatus Diapherotrites archaeon]
MKLHLITCSEQPVDFLPELDEFLISEVSDIDVEIHYVAGALDLPLQAKISLQTADIAFVTFAYEAEDTRILMILEKLVQIELETGKKIIKALHESSFNEILTEEDLEKEKQT